MFEAQDVANISPKLPIIVAWVLINYISLYMTKSPYGRMTQSTKMPKVQKNYSNLTFPARFPSCGKYHNAMSLSDTPGTICWHQLEAGCADGEQIDDPENNPDTCRNGLGGSDKRWARPLVPWSPRIRRNAKHLKRLMNVETS